MRILDAGSGPELKLVSNYTEIEVVPCDIRDLPGIDRQDMEHLSYADKIFDLVICINALDHTPDARQALEELIRVGKQVYINCAIDQRTRHRKKHYWDAKSDGRFVNPEAEFDLKDYDFEIDFEDGRMIAWLV